MCAPVSSTSTSEGIWGEVIYSSIGLWSSLIEDPELIREAAHAENEWLVSEIQSIAPDRLVPAALMPMLDVDDAVAELHHAAEIGLKIVSLPTGPPAGDATTGTTTAWEPLWAAAEEAGMVIGFHIGTDGADQAAVFRGPGGAVLNYVGTVLRRPARRDEARRVGRARPPSTAQGPDLRGRRDAGCRSSATG